MLVASLIARCMELAAHVHTRQVIDIKVVPGMYVGDIVIIYQNKSVIQLLIDCM